MDAGVGAGGALVFFVLKADRNSQCFFNPCTKSSEFTTIVETLESMFEFA